MYILSQVKHGDVAAHGEYVATLLISTHINQFRTCLDQETASFWWLDCSFWSQGQIFIIWCQSSTICGFVDPREDRELHLYIYTPLTIDTCPSTNICEDNQINDCWVSTELGDTTSLVGIKTCSILISFSSDVCFSATYIAQHKPGFHCVLLKGESYGTRATLI